MLLFALLSMVSKTNLRALDLTHALLEKTNGAGSAFGRSFDNIHNAKSSCDTRESLNLKNSYT